MKAANLKNACGILVAAVIFLAAINDLRAQSSGKITLNQDAVAFAVQLIKEGHFVADGKGAWGQHRLSADEENEFIRLHGIAEYAKWHLGINPRFPINTKRRYKFPYGDFKNVHRCGVLAAKARARQYGYSEIENAANELERAIKIKTTDRQALPKRSVAAALRAARSRRAATRAAGVSAAQLYGATLPIRQESINQFR